MRIPNYDSNKRDNEKISLNNFINEDYRMLISEQSACGITNTLIHMLRKPLVHYDKIYIYIHQINIKINWLIYKN